MLIYVIVGAVLGFLSGLGIGGGSLLILWLTSIMEIPAEQAQIVNLMFFLCAAGTVTLFRWKKGTRNPMRILPAVICGCLSAALFSYISLSWDKQVLKKLFGILLLATGMKELLYRPRKAR